MYFQMGLNGSKIEHEKGGCQRLPLSFFIGDKSKGHSIDDDMFPSTL